MSQYFPKRFRSSRENINVKVDLSNYATKNDLKNIVHVHISSFSLRTNLAGLKAEADNLAPVLVVFSKLSDVVKNDVVKKTVYDKLVAIVNNIDTSAFILKTISNRQKGIRKENC